MLNVHCILERSVWNLSLSYTHFYNFPTMESEDDLQSLGECKFNPSGIEDCEDIEHYEPGDYPPVLLDDFYDGNRYKIIHKLESGGFSTVWLQGWPAASSETHGLP